MVRQQRARVILGVLSDAVVSESSVFALWSQCGQSIWLPSEQRPAALDLQIPVDSVVVSVCVCVHVFFILSYSKGFASPRLELLHNIDPQYDDIAPCKSSLHLPSLTSPSLGPKAFSPHMLRVCVPFNVVILPSRLIYIRLLTEMESTMWYSEGHCFPFIFLIGRTQFPVPLNEKPEESLLFHCVHSTMKFKSETETVRNTKHKLKPVMGVKLKCHVDVNESHYCVKMTMIQQVLFCLTAVKWMLPTLIIHWLHSEK